MDSPLHQLFFIFSFSTSGLIGEDDRIHRLYAGRPPLPPPSLLPPRPSRQPLRRGARDCRLHASARPFGRPLLATAAPGVCMCPSAATCLSRPAGQARIHKCLLLEAEVGCTVTAGKGGPCQGSGSSAAMQHWWGDDPVHQIKSGIMIVTPMQRRWAHRPSWGLAGVVVVIYAYQSMIIFTILNQAA